MDLVSLGGKFLQSVRSGRALSITPFASDKPEVPARVAVAAAVARTIAALPPHERLNFPSTLGGSVSVYGGRPHGGEKPEELDDKFYEQDFDPVRHMLENLPVEDVDQKYFDSMVAQRLLQLDFNTEKLSRKVMEHHEEMVKGMQLVMELEKDLKVTNIICKNGRRHLSSAIHEVSQNLLVTSNVKKKKVLMDILPILVKIQHAMDIKLRLEGIVEEGDYAKALRMCSACMQLMDECSEIAAVMDMNLSIEDWLQRTLEKVDHVLLEVCQSFEADKYRMVIDAYAMIDDGGLGEKVQNCFVQIVVLETHAVLKNLLYEGEDPALSQKKCRLPYNDLCVRLPESKFRQCLHKTLEVLFDLMCSYFSMMTWQPPLKARGRLTGDIECGPFESGPLGSGKQKSSSSYHTKEEHMKSHESHKNEACSTSLMEIGNSDAEYSSVGTLKGAMWGLNDSEAGSCSVTSHPFTGSSTAIVIGDDKQDLFLGESQDIGKVIDEAVMEGSLSDLTANMRKETIVNVSKALDKGRKHVWELAARRVSALLSCDALCTTSPHHFLQSLDWVNRFVLAGEAFSGAEAISLRAKLVKLCEKYFGTFHRQNLEVLRMMLEKEAWQQLSPAAIKTVNLAGLLGDGAPVLVTSPVGLPRGTDSRVSHSETEHGVTGKEENQAGFAFWLERGNPFSDKKSQGFPMANNNIKQASKAMGQSYGNIEDKEQFPGAGAQGTMVNGAVEQLPGQSGEVEEDENEDLLADFIDEDSQLPSRVYKSFKNGQAHVVDEENLILTGSAVGILRYMDKYARLMQILQPIATEVFRGFGQLFELYFHCIFKLFGHRDALSGARGQVDNSNLLTARLRATLVRISQGLEDQRSKNAMAANNQPPYSTPSSQLNHSDIAQMSQNQGASSSFLSAVNMYGLKERYVAVESLSCVAQMLKRSRSHLQTVLTQDALASLDNFYSRTVDVVADLREHVYRTVARLLLNVSGYVDRIGNVRWELKEIGTEHNGYVDLLLGEFKHFANKLAHADLSKEIREILLEYGVDTLAEVLLEGFSRVKKCTNEGRALMSLDLQVLINGLRHLAPQRLAVNLHVVEAYIKAYYLPETEYLHWARGHPEYTKAQVISLINLVAYCHKWTRKSRAEVLEKIEAGEF